VSAGQQLRFKIRILPAIRLAGVFWLVVGVCSLLASDFGGRTYFTIVGLVVGPGMLPCTRPIRVSMDASANLLRVRTPRLPVGSTVREWPMSEVDALETLVVPDAFAADMMRFDGCRLVWRLRSGERVTMRFTEWGNEQSRRHRDRVNAFLLAQRQDASVGVRTR
jgi:hypothetical protein